MWGHLKSKSNANKPRTKEELKTNIRLEIAESLVKTMENVATQAVLAIQGRNLKDIIFKK